MRGIGPASGSRAERTALVVGLGSAEHGDGAAGVEVIRLLRDTASIGLDLRECSDARHLFDWWRGCDAVIVVDAAAGDRPGRVYRFEAHRHPVPILLRSSARHHWGPAEAVELSRARRGLPPRVIVYAIEANAFESAPLSAAVERAAASVAQEIRRELSGAAAYDTQTRSGLRATGFQPQDQP
jgi:hydrogenase maturation protease